MTHAVVNGEGSGPGVEAVVVFRRPKIILAVTRLRRERQLWRDIVIGVQFERVVLCLVYRINGRFDCTQIGGLRCVRIRIKAPAYRANRHAFETERLVVGQHDAVRHLKCIARIK